MSYEIFQGFPIPPNDYYRVYVNSCTYNQTSYIEDCLNGVAIQETNFQFVHQVIDDASTDGEQNVIKAWMDRECDMDHAEYFDNDICTVTIVRNKKNPNCTHVVYFLKKNMYGNPKKHDLYKSWQEVCQYQAECEGDDYWTDSLKLQKQVDFLDSHPGCMLTYHACENMDENGNTQFCHYIGKNVQEKYTIDELLQGYKFQTATILYRKEVVQSDLYRNIKRCGFPFGDVLLYLVAATMGTVEGSQDIMSVYRRLPTGASLSELKNSRKGIQSCRAWIKSSKYFDKANRKKLQDFVICRNLGDVIYGMKETKFANFLDVSKLVVWEIFLYPKFIIYIFIRGFGFITKRC